jgi:diketogulonate reductase-like aldo/keto reductase
MMRTTFLPGGAAVPVLGQGTWYLGDDPRTRSAEIAALQAGIDLGMSLIDTAEMYGDGASERLVGAALEGRRDRVFLVDKVLPHHADRRGVVAACERSLKRLGTDRIDLYLLHWRGGIPLQETLAGFEALRDAGKIRHWGVSNFDDSDMQELQRIPGGPDAATNQVLYNLTRRGIEFDLLPQCRKKKKPLMAYSPVEQGRLLRHPALASVASRLGATPAQVALAWVLRHDGMIAIPKAASVAHVRENHGALDLVLNEPDLRELDRAFPPPNSKQPLEMI